MNKQIEKIENLLVSNKWRDSQRKISYSTSTLENIYNVGYLNKLHWIYYLLERFEGFDFITHEPDKNRFRLELKSKPLKGAIDNLLAGSIGIRLEKLFRCIKADNYCIENNTVDYIKYYYPNITINVGMKISKFFTVLYQYLQLADNPIYTDVKNMIELKAEQTEVLYIGYGLYDFMRMSYGNSWSSCHNPSGCHASGSISYAMDKTTFVLYREKEDDTLISRSILILNDNTAIIGKEYGNTLNTDIIQIILNLIGYGVNYASKNELPVEYHWNATAYSDFFGSFWNSTLYTEVEYEYIGTAPLCIECGYFHNNNELLNCCEPIAYCSSCDSQLNLDDAIIVDGDYYCSNCVAYCEECEEYHRINDVNSYSLSGHIYDICYNCFSKYFEYCDSCGEVYRIEDMEWVQRKDTDGYEYEEFCCTNCI